MDSEDTIWVVTEVEQPAAPSALPRLALSPAELRPLSVEALSRNLQVFLKKIGVVLLEQPSTVGGFEVDEVELSLAVNATGGIELIGKLTAGAEACIRIKLKRTKRPDTPR